MAPNDRYPGGMSSEAVARATGRTWSEWLAFLDDLGAETSTHKEIVALVAGPGGLTNGWWQQSIAVGYEQARGKRVVGQTTAGGFQIGVQKTLPIPADRAWDLVTGDAGRATWLGETASLEFRKGEHYETTGGTCGEVRSIVPGERIRLTWLSPGLAGPSTLQVTLVPSGDRTSFRFHQERLSSLEERELMRTHWRAVLDRLLEAAQQAGGSTEGKEGH
ncbi:MAG: SRPBCC domain-containing protein [Chloroflexi bacterium]|nr:SRPBCC domain-containing protein [Chloroflexota bacterium]